MCFIKNQELGNHAIYQPCGNNCHNLTFLENTNNPFFPIYNAPFVWNNQLSQHDSTLDKLYQQLQMVTKLLQSNSQIIHDSFEKLEKNQNDLISLDFEIDCIFKPSVEQIEVQDQEVKKYMQESTSYPAQSSVIYRLFGNREYRFRIKPTRDLPKVIYKERNLQIPLQLVTSQGKLVKNGNLIHLCIAVCDQQAKWIVDENDQFFIQGKVQVDLYRGECQFLKIYPKDISRHFPGGKVNIIVYPKPSILLPNQSLGKGQYMINCEEIEPLSFSNILIKAKKKLR